MSDMTFSDARLTQFGNGDEMRQSVESMTANVDVDYLPKMRTAAIMLA